MPTVRRRNVHRITRRKTGASTVAASAAQPRQQAVVTYDVRRHRNVVRLTSNGGRSFGDATPLPLRTANGTAVFGSTYAARAVAGSGTRWYVVQMGRGLLTTTSPALPCQTVQLCESSDYATAPVELVAMSGPARSRVYYTADVAAYPLASAPHDPTLLVVATSFGLGPPGLEHEERVPPSVVQMGPVAVVSTVDARGILCTSTTIHDTRTRWIVEPRVAVDASTRTGHVVYTILDDDGIHFDLAYVRVVPDADWFYADVSDPVTLAAGLELATVADPFGTHAPAVAAADGHVHTVVASRGRIVYVTSRDNGTTWTAPRRFGRDASHSNVAASSVRNVWATWFERSTTLRAARIGGRAVRVATTARRQRDTGLVALQGGRRALLSYGTHTAELSR
jgi:hypothetical protein